MKASSRKKIAVAFALMLIVAIAVAPCAFAITGVSSYYDDDFDVLSVPDYIGFSIPCDYISIMATCEDDANGNPQVDNHMTCYIEDLDHEGIYSMVIPFVADGSVHNLFGGFAAGAYAVYITGTAGIVKDYARVVFSTTVY